MTIIEDLVFVADAERFSIVVPEGDVIEAINLKEVTPGLLPNDMHHTIGATGQIVPEEVGKPPTWCTLEGLKIKSARVGGKQVALHQGKEINCVCVCYTHEANPNSRVKQVDLANRGASRHKQRLFISKKTRQEAAAEAARQAAASKEAKS